MPPSQVTENKILNSRITKNKISPITNHVNPPIPPPPQCSFPLSVLKNEKKKFTGHFNELCAEPAAVYPDSCR